MNMVLSSVVALVRSKGPKLSQVLNSYQLYILVKKKTSSSNLNIGQKGKLSKKRIFYGQANPKEIFLFLRVKIGRI